MARKILDFDKKYVGITISLPPELIKLMDSDRGQKSRAAFINYLIEQPGKSILYRSSRSFGETLSDGLSIRNRIKLSLKKSKTISKKAK